MTDLSTSIIRTVVPWIVGAVVAWLANKGVHVSDAQVASGTAILAVGAGTMYYIVVRFLESKFPKLGFLLGVPAKPTYNTQK